MKNNKNSKDYQISEDLINGYSPEGFYDSEDDSNDKAILQIYKTHGIFPAVKFYKDIASEDLITSKDYVESLLVENNLMKSKEDQMKITNEKISKFEEKGKKMQKTGCSMILLAIIIIAVIAIVLMIV